MTDKVTEYTYNSLGIIDHVKTMQSGKELPTWYQFDELFRVNQSQVKMNGSTAVDYTYQYKDGKLAGSTTGQIETFTVNGKTYDYLYDVRGKHHADLSIRQCSGDVYI